MDRRLTPATDRVALRGSGIARDTLTEGRPMRVAAPVADLHALTRIYRAVMEGFHRN